MSNRFHQRFRRLARTLTAVELMESSDHDWPLTDRDLLDKNAGRRFLDFYGDRGLRIALDRYGILGALARRGYDDVSLVMRVEDDQHTLFVETDIAGRRERLIELCVRRTMLLPSGIAGMPELRPSYDVLSVDWLSLRHPRGVFSADRPQLPGQDLPGLGMGNRVHAVLMRMVARLELSALVTVAEHYHNAEVYAREMPYFDPREMGKLRAMMRDLRVGAGLSLAETSWAIERGEVVDETGEVVKWRGELQLSTEDKSLAAYLESDEYEALAASTAAAKSYRLISGRAPLPATG